MTIDGFATTLVRTRSGLTIRWTDAAGKSHVANGALDADVTTAFAGPGNVLSANLPTVKMRKAL
jgi:hypothetical protein